MAVSQKLTLSQVSQSAENNTSQVRILWESTQTGGSYNLTQRTAYYWVSINGGQETKYSISYILPSQSTTVLLDTVLMLPHDENGEGSIQVRTWMNTNISAGVVTLQEAFTPDTITRESTVSAYEVYIGMVCDVTIQRKNSLYTHTVGYSFGNLSGYLTEEGRISAEPTRISGTTVPFLVPDSFYAEIPDSLSGICKLICTTYLDDEQIGEPTETEFSVCVDENHCGPVVTGSVYDINEATLALTGSERSFIRYHSTAQCEITAVGMCAAEINKTWINGTETPENTLIIPQIQQDHVLFTAEDSRGIPESRNEEIELILYTHLTGNGSVERTDPTSGNAVLSVSGSCFEGGFGACNNALTVQYQIGSGDLQDVTEVTWGEGKYSAKVDLSGLDYRKVFNITVKISDLLETVEKKLTLKKGIPVFDWGEDDFAFHVPVQMDGALNVDGRFTVSGKSLLDHFYPKDTVYSTASDSDPSELFGGTWEQIGTDGAVNRWKRTQ